MSPALALRDVVVRYGDVTAVDGVSFEVQRGELVTLLGGSGSGKTTTLECINRLARPSSGRVEVGGVDVQERLAHELRRQIGYCFQGLGLFEHLSVADNIAVTPRLLGWTAARIRERVTRLLALVSLEPETHGARRPSELSGGQRQRVAVARALAAEPPVVLFDEPFGKLDPLTREQLWDALGELRSELGFAAVFVTHDVSEALVLGDRVGVMHEGRLLQIDRPTTLASSPADPYVARLLEVPRRTARLLEAQR